MAKKTIATAYADLKPATTLRELFEQFDKQIRLPAYFSSEPVRFNRKTGKPETFAEKPRYSTDLNLAKTREINDEDWSTTPALKATNKVFDQIGSTPFFVMDGKYYSLKGYNDDGYMGISVSRIKPQVVK
jgi:hypothetical protein